jgi:hypothetical protein
MGQDSCPRSIAARRFRQNSSSYSRAESISSSASITALFHLSMSFSENVSRHRDGAAPTWEFFRNSPAPLKAHRASGRFCGWATVRINGMELFCWTPLVRDAAVRFSSMVGRAGAHWHEPYPKRVRRQRKHSIECSSGQRRNLAVRRPVFARPGGLGAAGDLTIGIIPTDNDPFSSSVRGRCSAKREQDRA